MTVTLTKEEVQDFKNRMLTWAKARTEYLNEKTVEANNGVIDKSGEPVNVMTAMTTWEEENPAPTIVKI